MKGQLEKQIRATLAADERSRNSDIRLTQAIWFRYYHSSMLEHNGLVYVEVAKMYDLPREDNIKRIRAKIQNEQHEFLPTSEAVARKRKWNIQEWRDYLGYAPKGEVGRRAMATQAELNKLQVESLQKDDRKDEKNIKENQSLFTDKDLPTPQVRRPNGYDIGR